jgi:hypothetical protein
MRDHGFLHLGEGNAQRFRLDHETLHVGPEQFTPIFLPAGPDFPHPRTHSQIDHQKTFRH